MKEDLNKGLTFSKDSLTKGGTFVNHHLIRERFNQISA